MLGQIQIEYLNESTRDTYYVTNLEQVEKALKEESCWCLLELREEDLSGSTFINLEKVKLIVLIPEADDDNAEFDLSQVEYGEDDEDEDY